MERLTSVGKTMEDAVTSVCPIQGACPVHVPQVFLWRRIIRPVNHASIL